MECPEKFDHLKDMSVHQLVTKLCEKISDNNRTADDFVRLKRPLVKKMRSKAYEILLRKSSTLVVTRRPSEPIMDLLSCYFHRNFGKSDIGDYKDLIRLKECIDWVIERTEDEIEPYFNEILTCVVLLKDTVPSDGGKFMFENPFTFGRLDEMLPKITDVQTNEPKPYQHFPAEIFKLPFAASYGNDDALYPYVINSFLSTPGTNLTHLNKLGTTAVYSNGNSARRDSNRSPLTSISYLNSCLGFPACPRLTEPRDLYIPTEDNISLKHLNMKSNTFNSEKESTSKTNNVSSGPITSLWELASVNVDFEPDSWERASKMPPVNKRNFISSSYVQMSHWKKSYRNQLSKLNVISESQFILHLKYLTIGIASSSFYFDMKARKFLMKSNLCLDGLHQNTLQTYVADVIKTGTCYWKLNNLITLDTSNGEILREGFVYKSMCDTIRQYLVWFRLEIDKIFGEGLVTIEHERRRLPTLIEIVHNLKPLAMQIQTMARIYKVYENDYDESCLRGTGLMAHLYNEITTVTQNSVSSVLYAALQSICQVYFRFIQRFIFEGEIDDRFSEFFIKKDNQYVNSYNKLYWNKGFIIRNNETVPEFLKDMAKDMLLCGKSLRLLKLCNPDDPLCVMLSTDYPHIKCCLTFEDIKIQQQLYDQYRTQCLYVCGEPMTFQSLLIQKETEKRAFREMVILKQAETMEKLIEERKRLSRMLFLNKRKQFSALREAAENAIAKRNLERKKTVQEEKLLMEHFKTSEKLHKLQVEEEKKRVMAFYNEIEREVNKRKIMADWKIKRLKLDLRRVQLLTSEKVNWSRECLELKCHDVDNEESYNNSNSHNTKSSPTSSSVTSDQSPLLQDTEIINNIDNNVVTPIIRIEEEKYSPNSPNVEIEESPIQISNFKDNNMNSFLDIQTSNTTKSRLNNNPINSSDINSNIPSNTERTNIPFTELSPSDFLNSNILLLDEKSNNNIQNTYQNQKLEAMRNKQKVMAHEFGMDSTTVNSDNFLSVINNNVSEAQRNRLKVLGSNFNAEKSETDHVLSEAPQYNTEASKQALKNKQKVLGHEFGIDIDHQDKTAQSKRRNVLTLDLQSTNRPPRRKWANNAPSSNANTLQFGVTPDSCANTPNDMNERLDIETPSTFDVEPFGLPSAATLSPTSAQVVDSSCEANNVTKMGFRFPHIIEEHHSDDESVLDYPIENEPTEDEIDGEECNFEPYNVKSTVWNFSNDDLNFDGFKPFGIDSTREENFKTLDIFDRPLALNSNKSPYLDINEIIHQAQKSPTTNIFMLASDVNENLLQKVENVDLSTIATCLQRSVMIPLSYQMEMVNNATLKYFLINCDLYDHLKNIRDYFFLMDGEFAKTICTNIFEKLNTIENPNELLNFATLHSILNKSFGSSVCGSNKYAENLSFIVSDMPASFHYSSPDVLECLTLSYTVSWPLNIIFSQEAMDRYGKVFQFLLKMRRISWALECDSEVLKMSLKEEFMVSKELLRSPQYHSVQLYRYTMSSLMRALHGYISTICLQSSWKEFEKDLIGAQTLDDLYSIHVVYVKRVMFRCLLNNRSLSIMKLLNDIFAVILQFHHFLNARCWHIAENEVHYTHPLFSRIRESFLRFDKLSKHFHKMLTRLIDCGYQPHLSELLTVLNMNDYYNKTDDNKK